MSLEVFALWCLPDLILLTNLGWYTSFFCLRFSDDPAAAHPTIERSLSVESFIFHTAEDKV